MRRSETSRSKKIALRSIMTEEAAYESAPEGTKPMMISTREMETYELKTGPALGDTLDFKIFDRSYIVDQIQQVGFMCPFHGFRKEIGSMKTDQVLIISDREERYGENWLLCLTKASFDSQYEIIQKNMQVKNEENDDKEGEKEEEDNNESLLVYEDKPIVPAEWNSETKEETTAEVQQLTIQSKRRPIILTITRPATEFSKMYKFSDRDSDSGFMECRQHKDPNYELSRLEQDIGLQTIPPLIDESTQTTWFRSVNSALQYEPIKISKEACVEGLNNPKFISFLERAIGDIEEALQQNETIDIFTDEFSNLIEEDIAFGLKNESNIKELRTFTDLEYSKNKTLVAIDWHPCRKGVVAVSAVSNFTYDERLELAEKVDNSHLLIWNFSDLIHPQLMLESPQEAYTFRFNPTQPTIIAAGSFSGQVILWNITEAEAHLTRQKNKAASASTHSKIDNVDDDDLNKKFLPVKHEAISYIDYSHRRPVSDLCWLPPGLEVTNRGHILETNDTVTHQFVTVAGDGQVLFWDLRYKDPAHRTAAKVKAEKVSNKDSSSDIHFTPLHRVVLNKIDGVGELALRCAVLEGIRADPLSESGHSVSSKLYCSTEDGKMVLADWKPSAATTQATEGQPKGNDGIEYVQCTNDQIS